MDVSCQILEYAEPAPLSPALPIESGRPAKRDGGGGSVETAFSVLLTYADRRSVVGQFGFNSVYRNRVDLLGERLGVEIDRVYTTPPDVALELRVTRPDGVSNVSAPPGDAFAVFFDQVCERIEDRDWGQLADDMLADARALDRLRRAAGVV
jgi:hypothetical protein